MSEYAKILLVEDDESLAQWVIDYLREHSFYVDHVKRGDEVVAALKAQQYDLVLLDVMLPGLNGVDVCRAIRQFSSLPVIMMTARSDEFDEVIGLEVGANDYVIKPVRPRALLARIKAFLRQSQSADTDAELKQELVFGKLSINLEAERVVYQGQEIELSSGLFALLWLLACNAGTVMNRDAVFKQLKGREYDGLDRRFDVMVSSLRRKLDDDPQKPQKIKTIWGKGYLFVADAW